MRNDGAWLYLYCRPPSLPRWAEEHQRRITRVDIHRHSTATAGANDDIGFPLIKFGLGDFRGGFEIVVGEGWVDDRVAVVFEVGRLQGDWGRGPTVKEEDFHCSLAQFDFLSTSLISTA